MPYFKNAKVSASFGKIENENSDECEFLPFDKQYLRQKFRIYSTDNLGITPCIGNSMSPTINEGDKVIFQKTSDIIESAIYVIRKNGELFIKRVSKSPFILLSDNSQSASAYKRWRHD